MLGRVGLRGSKSWLSNCAASHRMRALGAELCSCGKQGAAVSTDPCQRSGALLAELRLWSVFKLALRTFHTETSTAGREKLKVEPWPGALDTVIRPPCSSTSKRVITSPSPVPPAWGERSWALKNLVKSCA